MKKLFVFIVGVFLVFSNTQIIYAKCTKEVTKGMVVKNEVISAGETQVVWNGGKTENIIVNAGGRQLVCSDGVSKGTVINALGFQYVDRDGFAFNTIIKEKGVQHSRGISADTTISGGIQSVTGSAFRTKIENRGIQLVDWTGKSVYVEIKNGIQHVDKGSIKNYNYLRDKIDLGKKGIRNVYDPNPNPLSKIKKGKHYKAVIKLGDGIGK